MFKLSIAVSIMVSIKLVAMTTMEIKEQNEHCPPWCICDIYMDLIVANCSAQNLIDANFGIPTSIEFLDLSNNDIIMIDNNCFSELIYVNTLLLNRNAISFIELEAFSSLQQLEFINLSDNRLELLDNRLFEQNNNLIDVNLSANKFMHLPNEPILCSKSIQTMDLHKSQLTHLHVKYFEELPNIRSIDLSDNLLIVFNLAAFAVNNRLENIDIRGNRMKCDAQMEMSIIWLKRIHVNVHVTDCPKEEPTTTTVMPQKFERMQLSPVTEGNKSKIVSNESIHDMHEPNTFNINNINNNNSHSYNKIPVLNKKCMENETNSHACHLFETCSKSLSLLLEEVDHKLLLKHNNMNTNCNLMNLHNWSEFVTIQMAFYGGLFLGAMIGAIILFMMKLIYDCIVMPNFKTTNRKRRYRRNFTSEIRSSNDESTLLNDISQENHGHNENVIRMQQQQQQQHRICENNNRSVRRYDQRPSTSFFAIFYERPARRRYYQNATNLVRRLSQSRLFLNSSRAQRNNNSQGNRATVTQIQSNSDENHRSFESIQQQQQESENEHENQLVEQTRNICISVHSLNVSDNDRFGAESRRNGNRTYASDLNLSTQIDRSETPPPPYMIVVND